MNSRYKNPDRFIKQLKNRIDFLEKLNNLTFKNYERECQNLGNQQMSWVKNTLGKISVLGNKYEFKVGQTILEIGQVKNVYHDESGTNIEVERSEVRTIDDELYQ